MKTIRFHLDFVSPYAWLAFDALPRALEGLSYAVEYRPVLLGALFQAHGITAPAAVPAKHAWIKRQTAWLAGQNGTELAWPATHPFSSLPLLRLALACGNADGSINRYTAETLFRHAWAAGGAEALDEARLPGLREKLAQQWQPHHPPGSEANKARLRRNTDAAAQAGVFGVPACEVDGQVFWGLDALPMLRVHLLDEPSGS